MHYRLKQITIASMTDMEKFMDRVSPEPNSGCWLWVGTEGAGGYGSFYSDKGIVRAHRWSFVTFNGKLRKGKLVCHRCDTPACVNPKHLFAGTHKDNAADCVAKGRLRIVRRPKKALIVNEDGFLPVLTCPYCSRSWHPQKETLPAFCIKCQRRFL